MLVECLHTLGVIKYLQGYISRRRDQFLLNSEETELQRAEAMCYSSHNLT